jgi:hypothetical protein
MCTSGTAQQLASLLQGVCLQRMHWLAGQVSACAAACAEGRTLPPLLPPLLLRLLHGSSAAVPQGSYRARRRGCGPTEPPCYRSRAAAGLCYRSYMLQVGQRA